MGEHTDIQWCDSTVNPTTGCDGCELWKPGRGGPCYAGNFHEKRLARSFPNLYSPSFTDVRLAPGRMAKAAAWPDLRGRPRPDKPWIPPSMPRLIFVGDMGDVFSKAVPFDYLESELVGAATSAKGRRHIWMVLTKQARRAAEFHHWLLDRGTCWPENVRVGTSVTGRRSISRVGQLMRIRAMLFVSAEPLVEDVADDLAAYLRRGGTTEDDRGVLYNTPTQVIIGGESFQNGHEARPFGLDWARRLIAACRDHGAAPFVKQLGSTPMEGMALCGDCGHPRAAHQAKLPAPCTHGRTDPWAAPGTPAYGCGCLGFVRSKGRIDLRDHHGGDWSEWPEDLRVRQMPEVAA
jgi:protein gp37